MYITKAIEQIDYCTPLNLDRFPNATTLFSLSFEFIVNSGDAVLL